MAANLLLVSLTFALVTQAALGRDLAPRVAGAPDARRLTLRFTEHHPLGSLDEVCARTGFRREHMPDRDGPGRWEYDLADESFEVVVPRSYRPRVPHGLFVFIPPSDAPAPRGWVEALARRRMI